METGKTKVISVLVENKPGVLHLIANLFRRRNFNIESITVGPTQEPDIARMTITVREDEKTIDQVVKTTEALRENNFVFIETIECLMRSMQVERGKTRPNTMMTGHTGYITHARKILKLPVQETPQTLPQEEPTAVEPIEETENSKEMAEEETA